MKSYSSIRQSRMKKAIIELLGGKCAQCGFADFRALQIDHRAGQGHSDIKGGGTAYYDRVLKLITANPGQVVYQLLCANCNWIKRAEQDENPQHYGRVDQDAGE